MKSGLEKYCRIFFQVLYMKVFPYSTAFLTKTGVVYMRLRVVRSNSGTNIAEKGELEVLVAIHNSECNFVAVVCVFVL